MATTRTGRRQQAPRRARSAAKARAGSRRARSPRGRGKARSRGNTRARGNVKRAKAEDTIAAPVIDEIEATGLFARLRGRRAERAATRRSKRELAAATRTQHEGEGPSWTRRLTRAGLRLGIVGLVAWALLVGGREVYEYATTSARFEARHLIYEPSEHVDDDTLRELIAIEPGTNILALDLAELSERVVAHPWVAEATVVRNLPDTLEIALVEHEPRAIVLAGKFYLVDTQGRPFKEVERGERGELPIITGIEREQLADADAREQAVTELERALEILDLYQSKQRPRLGELHLGGDGSLTLYTAESGTQLRLGRDEFAARLERWDALRVALGERADRLAVVHLDHESKPDRKDRVVARFAQPGDAAVLLAQADAAQPQGEDQDQDQEDSATAEPGRQQLPARQAGRRNRIPRYE